VSMWTQLAKVDRPTTVWTTPSQQHPNNHHTNTLCSCWGSDCSFILLIELKTPQHFPPWFLETPLVVNLMFITFSLFVSGLPHVCLCCNWPVGSWSQSFIIVWTIYEHVFMWKTDVKSLWCYLLFDTAVMY